MLTIPPEAALAPGQGDPAALLCVWYVRRRLRNHRARAHFGVVIGRDDQLTIGADTADQFRDELRSPLAGVIVGVAIRVVGSFAALALAYPLARAREAELPPRAYLGSSLTGILDRLNVARATAPCAGRTTSVRSRCPPRGDRRRLARLDPIMDAVNVALIVIAIVTLLLLGGTSGCEIAGGGATGAL